MGGAGAQSVIGVARFAKLGVSSRRGGGARIECCKLQYIGRLHADAPPLLGGRFGGEKRAGAEMTVVGEDPKLPQMIGSGKTLSPPA